MFDLFGGMKEARSPYTNFVTLRELAESKRPKLRAAVAANPNLQTYMMEKLTADPSEMVRVALATNPHLSTKAWEKLNEDESAAVRASLMEHHPEKPEKLDARKQR